jgi:hypothetical protein
MLEWFTAPILKKSILAGAQLGASACLPHCWNVAKSSPSGSFENPGGPTTFRSRDFRARRCDFRANQDHAWRTVAATLNVSCGSGHGRDTQPPIAAMAAPHGNPESGNRFDSVNSAIS